MAWLAVDKNGTESIFYDKPIRNERCDIWGCDEVKQYMDIQPGTIKNITKKVLTWDDGPIEI